MSKFTKILEALKEEKLKQTEPTKEAQEKYFNDLVSKLGSNVKANFPSITISDWKVAGFPKAADLEMTIKYFSTVPYPKSEKEVGLIIGTNVDAKWNRKTFKIMSLSLDKKDILGSLKKEIDKLDF